MTPRKSKEQIEIELAGGVYTPGGVKARKRKEYVEPTEERRGGYRGKPPAKKKKPKKPVGPPKRVSVFIYEYLVEFGDTYPSDLHRKYREFYRGTVTTRGTPQKIASYNSFAVMISKLILIGLLERTGETEPSDDPRAEGLDYPERVFITLSDKGRNAPDHVWQNPLRLYYYPEDWELAEYREYIRS